MCGGEWGTIALCGCGVITQEYKIQASPGVNLKCAEEWDCDVLFGWETIFELILEYVDVALK